jgi:hypothetical protein
MTELDSYIACPKFGGYRTAPACIVLDRYRICRRKCTSLERYLKDHPEGAKEAEDAAKHKSPALIKVSHHAGQSLPDAALRCSVCLYQARSERGLKTHLTRSHKRKTMPRM